TEDSTPCLFEQLGSGAGAMSGRSAVSNHACWRLVMHHDPTLDPTPRAAWSRRRVLGVGGAAAAAAWVTPSIVSVPAAAAQSLDCAVPDMGFGAATGDNGWVQTILSGAFSGGGALGVATTGTGEGGCTPALVAP